MATVNSEIKVGGGGDYTSLSAWEADKQTDLVADGDIQQAECFGGQDTTLLIVNGWTTDAANYVRIYAAAGAEAQVPYNTDGTAFRLEPSVNQTGIDVLGAPFTRIERIQVKLTQGTSIRQGIDLNGAPEGNETRVVGCHVLCDINGQTSRAAGIFCAVSGSANVQYVINCVVDGFDANSESAGIVSNSGSGRGIQYYNTVINCRDAYFGGAGRRVKNCVGFGSADEDFEAGYNAASDNNASEDTTSSVFTSNVQSISDPFVSSTDFHLASGSDIEGEGQDLSSDSEFPVAVDFDDVARDGSAPDIGAFEFVGAGGVTVVLVAAAATYAAGALGVAAGVVTRQLGPGVLAATGQPLSPLVGAVTVDLASALAVFSGAALSPSAGAVSVALVSADGTYLAGVLTVQAGTVTRNLAAAVATYAASALTPIVAGVVSLVPAAATFSGAALARTVGAITVSLGDAPATLDASALASALDAVVVVLTPADAVYTAADLLPVAGTRLVALGSADASLVAQVLTVTVGAVTVTLVASLATWSVASITPTTARFDNEVTGEVIMVLAVEGGVEIIQSVEGVVTMVRSVEGSVEI